MAQAAHKDLAELGALEVRALLQTVQHSRALELCQTRLEQKKEACRPG